MSRPNNDVAQAMHQKIRQFLESKELEDDAWKCLTHSPGVDVWRVKALKLEKVPKEQVGTFYDGDSYVVLHTYQDNSKRIQYDVFIWIGDYSSNDEYGVAAYKMAELDLVVLNDRAVQHREVQGCESDKFQRVFSALSILHGGYDSGFRKVTKDKIQRLLHISGVGKNVKTLEVEYAKENLSADDVFIIDNDDNLIQVNGAQASKDEKLKGAMVVSEIKSSRGKCQSEIIDDFAPGTSHPVINAMPSTTKASIHKKVDIPKEYSLHRLSDASGEMVMTLVSTGKCPMSSFDSSDVFIYDTNQTIFAWIGKGTSQQEKMGALSYALSYAEKNGKTRVPIVSVTESNESLDFKEELA